MVFKKPLTFTAVSEPECSVISVPTLKIPEAQRKNNNNTRKGFYSLYSLENILLSKLLLQILLLQSSQKHLQLLHL